MCGFSIQYGVIIRDPQAICGRHSGQKKGIAVYVIFQKSKKGGCISLLDGWWCLQRLEKWGESNPILQISFSCSYYGINWGYSVYHSIDINYQVILIVALVQICIRVINDTWWYLVKVFKSLQCCVEPFWTVVYVGVIKCF